MKLNVSFLLALSWLAAFAAAEAKPTSLKSKVLERTHCDLAAPWVVQSDGKDSDGDPEFELDLNGNEFSIAETSTVPFMTISASDAISEYMTMMRSMLKAKPQKWPKDIAKPSAGECTAYTVHLFEQKASELDLSLVCYLPFSGGTGLITATIASNATTDERANISDVLASCKIK